MLDIDAVLDRVGCLAGRRRTVESLPGGLTNTNLKVTTDDGCLVVRIASKNAGMLGIDRDAEHANSLAAHRAGVGAPVVEYAPELGVLVLEFIDGKTWHEDDLKVDGNIPRVAAACRALHSGPAFVGEFDMFEIQRSYLDVVESNGYRIPERYPEFMPTVDRMRRALEVRAEPLVPCNNDLLAENFIDDGTTLWLIDYEYAGNNDPCFELGNIASESHLSTDELAELVTAYYGAEHRNKIARARLLGVLSNYGWTLWASIQDSVSTIDFDFWSWGMDKYSRAVAEFDGPGIEQLLTDVQRCD